MKAFLLWWTADHIQAVKKLVVLVAGLLGYLLPPGLWQQIAVIVATGGLTDSTFGSIWKLLQDNAAKDARFAQKLGSSNALKALLVAAALGLVALPAPARAAGWDWSSGPTVPVLVYDLGSTTPMQVAPGAGVQVSVTNDALKVDIAGKAWDLLDAQGMVFGSLVSPVQGFSFGSLSAAVGVCTLSSLVCVGFGKHVLGDAYSLSRGGWFWTLSLSLNFAIAPAAPPSGVALGTPVPRGNTLYLFGG